MKWSRLVREPCVTAIASPLQDEGARGNEETRPPMGGGTGARRPHAVRPVALVGRARHRPETVLDRAAVRPVARATAVAVAATARSTPVTEVAKAAQAVTEVGVAAMAAARPNRRV